jgi:lipopolysaccharide biosynthesis glycosyltransferase
VVLELEHSGPHVAATNFKTDRFSLEDNVLNLNSEPTSFLSSSNRGPVHVALIFTADKVAEVGQAVRSLLFSTKSRPVVIHAITNPAGWDSFVEEVVGYPHLVYYPIEVCRKLVAPVLPFASPAIHIVAHCRAFLAEIISERVSRVLFMDNDITANQDISTCFDNTFKEDQMMAMAPDTGDVCQFQPDLCWPIGFQNQGQHGLDCGSLPGLNTPNWVNRLRNRPDLSMYERTKQAGGNTFGLEHLRERDRSRAAAGRKQVIGAAVPVQCINGTDYEPAQVNAGVILMDLKKMRSSNFIGRFIASVIRTARRLDFKPARWGDQDFLNNYIRLYPDHFSLLPCGCNYQYMGPRRAIRCPQQLVYLVHSWHLGTSKQTTDVYNNRYFFFKNITMRLVGTETGSVSAGYVGRDDLRSGSLLPLLDGSKIEAMETVAIELQPPEKPPNPPPLSPAWDLARFILTRFEYSGSGTCPHQTHSCESAASSSDEPVFYQAPFFVLSRSRSSLYAEQLWDQIVSVSEQSHHEVYHVIVVDEETRSFISKRISDFGVSLKRLIVIPRGEPSSPGRLDKNWEWEEACNRCGISCSEAQERRFLDLSQLPEASSACLCSQKAGDDGKSTDYALLRKAVDSIAKESPSAGGWVLYLDETQYIPWRHAAAHLAAQARSVDDLLIFQTLLPHRSPSNEEFAKQRIAQGKVGLGNFLFHSRHMDQTIWESGLQCDDFRTISNLAGKLRTRWIEDIPVAVAPSLSASVARVPAISVQAPFSALAKLPVQSSSLAGKLTVIIASYALEGFRPGWLQDTVRRYTGAQFASLVDQVIIVWNNPDVPPPKLPERALILHQKVNSLNNRWIETIPYIRTEAVLNIDDDMFLEHNAVMCMMRWWQRAPMRLIGPLTRTVDANGSYVMQDQLNGEPYALILPRAVILHRDHLVSYANADVALRSYVDQQEAKCDDVLLNMLTSSTRIGGKPLQIILPPASMFDRYSPCSAKFPTEAGGLALQRDRQQLRRECYQFFAQYFDIEENETFVQEFAHCERGGHPGELLSSPAFENAFLAQFQRSLPCTSGADGR